MRRVKGGCLDPLTLPSRRHFLSVAGLSARWSDHSSPTNSPLNAKQLHEGPETDERIRAAKDKTSIEEGPVLTASTSGQVA